MNDPARDGRRRLPQRALQSAAPGSLDALRGKMATREGIPNLFWLQFQTKAFFS
jgi:hypothetical protein